MKRRGTIVRLSLATRLDDDRQLFGSVRLFTNDDNRVAKLPILTRLFVLAPREEGGPLAPLSR